jgi:hypothetical protein
MNDQPSWLPPVLKQYLKIAYHSYRLCHTLGHYELATTGLLPNAVSAITMFDEDLKIIEMQYGTEWSLPTEMALLKAKLQLYSFACANSWSQRTGRNIAGSRVHEILTKAYTSAMTLIQKACNSTTEVAFWTSNLQNSVAYAVAFLLKLSSSEYQFVDQVATRNSISQAWALLHGWSDVKHDHLSRACAIIEYLSRIDTSEKNLSMTVTSRMAANILYGAAWCAKERFSKSVRDSKPLDYTSAAEIEESYKFDFDFQLLPGNLGGEYDWDFLFQDFEGRM